MRIGRCVNVRVNSRGDKGFANNVMTVSMPGRCKRGGRVVHP